LFDLAMTSIENGNDGSAGLYFAGMVGEQSLFALTLGQSSLFKGALLNEVKMTSTVSRKSLQLLYIMVVYYAAEKSKQDDFLQQQI
jgi:hypothetical protein